MTKDNVIQFPKVNYRKMYDDFEIVHIEPIDGTKICWYTHLIVTGNYLKDDDDIQS